MNYGRCINWRATSIEMGVFIGALHAITGRAMKGRELECCACGAKECVYLIEATSL